MALGPLQDLEHAEKAYERVKPERARSADRGRAFDDERGSRERDVDRARRI